MLLTLQLVAASEPTNEPFSVKVETKTELGCLTSSFIVLNSSVLTPTQQIEGTNFYTPLGIQYKLCHGEHFIAPLDSTYWQHIPTNVFLSLQYRSSERMLIVFYPESHYENVTITLINSIDNGEFVSHPSDGYPHLKKNLHRLERAYMFSRFNGVSIFKISYVGKRPLYLFHFGKFPPGIYAGTIYHVTSLESDTIFSSVLEFFEKYTPGFWLWNHVLKIFHIDLDSKIRESYDIFRDFAWDFLDEASRDLFLFFLVYVTLLPIFGPGLINIIISGVMSLLLIYIL